MPRSLRLHIPEPCHENWQNMTPQEQGRFCGSCQKTVVDFSMQTDQEVLNYFLKADHHVCGRFADDQLNKELLITERKKRFSWAYIWNVLLATFLFTEANAQVKPKPKKPVKTINRQQLMGEVTAMPEPVEPVMTVVLKGKVFDAETRQPLAGASITVKGTNGSFMCDSSGNFQCKVAKKDSLEIVVSFIGKESQTRIIDAFSNWQDFQIFLKPSFSNLAEVVVTSFPRTSCRILLGGGVRRVYTETKAEKIKRTINDWVPAALKKDLKIYPNPVVRGNSIQVSLALKQTGDYKLEILSAAGQVMLIQPLRIQTKEQLVDVHTETLWSAGIYWIRISSSNTKNVYEGKLLLQ